MRKLLTKRNGFVREDLFIYPTYMNKFSLLRYKVYWIWSSIKLCAYYNRLIFNCLRK
jgi:hypothetical protein